MSVYIIYPEQRWIDDTKLAMWYSDACTNGEVDDEYMGATTIKRMAAALSDAGIITLGLPLKIGDIITDDERMFPRDEPESPGWRYNEDGPFQY